MATQSSSVLPLPVEDYYRIFDRPPVTRAPANDLLDKDADDMAFVATALGSLVLLLCLVFFFATGAL